MGRHTDSYDAEWLEKLSVNVKRGLHQFSCIGGKVAFFKKYKYYLVEELNFRVICRIFNGEVHQSAPGRRTNEFCEYSVIWFVLVLMDL